MDKTTATKKHEQKMTSHSIPMRAYRVYAPGGVYFSADKIEDCENVAQEEVFLMLPPFVRFKAGNSHDNTKSKFVFTNGIELLVEDTLKSISRKAHAIPYIQTPYGFRDIFLKVVRKEALS